MFDKLLMAAAQPVAATDSDQYIANTELLLKGEGTNGQTNNTFVDSSASNHSITPYNDVTQGSFSPFSPKGWSGYSPNGINYWEASHSTGLQLVNTDFTLEAWIYLTEYPNNNNGYYISHILTKDSNAGNNTREYMWRVHGTATSYTHLSFFYFRNSFPYHNSYDSSFNFQLNTWYHIRTTKSGTNLYHFVNGTLIGTHTSIPQDTVAYTSNLRVGHDWNASSNVGTFKGYISNLRLIKGSALSTSDFTVPTEPLTAVTNTTLLAFQDNRSIDNSSSNHTITATGDVAIKPTSPFSGDREYPKASYFSGKFDGSNDYLTIASSNDFAFGTGDFTVEGYAYIRQHKNWNCLLTTRPTNGSYADAWYIGCNSSGQLILYSNQTLLISSANVVPTNQWFHFACTRSSSSTQLFVDGQQVATGTITSNFTKTVLGIGDFPTTQSEPFDGYLSNTRVVKGTALYTSAFTPPTAPLTPVANTKLLTLQDNYLVDHSSSSHSITNNGVALEPESPFSNSTYPLSGTFYSGYFDVTNDALSLSASSDFVFGTGDFTWECWFNRQSGTPNSGRLVQIGPTWGTTSSLGLGVYGSNHSTYPNKIFVYAWNLQQSTFIQSSITIADNEWHHVAVTRNNGVFCLYVDGVLRGSQSNYSGSTENVSTNDLHIGGEGASAATPSSENFLGYISNVRVVKGTALYTSDFTVPSEPLTAVSGTKLLTLQDATIQDNSASSHSITNNGVTITEIAPFGTELIDRAGSMYFGGSFDYLRHSSISHSDFAFGTGDFTLECWVYPISTDGNIFDTRTTLTNCGYGFAIGDGSTSGANIWDGCGTSLELLTNTLVPRRQWSHVAYTRQNGTIQIFVNGVSAGTASTGGRNNNVGGCLVATNINTLYGGSGSGLHGYISDLRVIKGTALYTSNFTPPTAPLQPITNTKLLLSGNNGGVEDSLGKRTFETDGNAQIDTTVKKFGSGAIEFDGNGDYLKGTGFDLSGKYTIEGWVYRRAQIGYQRIFVQCGPNWDWSSNGVQLSLYFNFSNHYLTLEIPYGQNSSPFVYQIQGSSTPAADTWHYFAVTCDGTNTSLFLNGSRVGTTPNAMPANWLNGLQTEFSIGNNGGISATNANDHFNGFLDDFRVTTGVARYDPTQTTHTVPTKTHPTI